MRLKADLLLFLVAVIWGTAFVAQRVAGQQDVVYLFNGTRYLLAALVVFPFVKRKESIPGEQWRWMLVAGFLLFVASALQQVGLVYTTAGNAGFITSLYVVLIPIILFLFWREKPHWIAIIAVSVSSHRCILAFHRRQVRISNRRCFGIGWLVVLGIPCHRVGQVRVAVWCDVVFGGAVGDLRIAQSCHWHFCRANSFSCECLSNRLHYLYSYILIGNCVHIADLGATPCAAYGCRADPGTRIRFFRHFGLDRSP